MNCFQQCFKFRPKICLTLTGMLLCMVMYGQQTITGTVNDENSESIPGVNVIVKGTTTGVVTDFDGKYNITVPNADAVLQISFVGYNTQEIVVGAQRIINVTLQEAATELDEVVVIGYQTVRRKDLTGSVASVSGKSIAASPVSNVAQAMQGKLPGVNIISQDGRPDAEISIRVRGGGSISQSNEPLILIDGIPGSINDIPADMVSSVDVLKDASSTAIYGARGANGVILVTTKKAGEGKVSVTYNGFVKFNNPAGYTDVLSPYDYLALKWGLLDAYGINTVPFETLFGLGANIGDNTNGIDSYRNVPAYNLHQEVYGSSISHNHDLSVAAGNEKTKVLFSLGYTDEQGMKLMSYAKRASASIKLDQKITRNLNLNLDIRYTNRQIMGNESTTSGQGSALSSAYRFRPISMDNMLGDVNQINDGTITGEDKFTMLDVFNPVRVINDHENLSLNQSVRGTAGINWEIIKGLTYRSELSLSRRYIQTKNWRGPTPFGNEESYISSTGTHTEATILYAGNADYRKQDSWSLRWTNTLNYDIVTGDIHRINILAGQEVTDDGGTDMRIQNDKFPANFTKENAFAMINQGTTNLRTSSGVDTPKRILSYFGRANYSLLDRYLFTFTMRADGSSNFSPEHRWGYFPAGAVAWRMSQESFMRNIPWLNDLKVRASYGTVGNDPISADQWSQLWEAETDNRWFYGLGNAQQLSYDLASSQMANRDLKWETTVTRNIGIDYTLFKNRLWGSIDFYKNNTKDLLMLVDIPGITGFTTTYDNIGKTSNKGVEFSINGMILQNEELTISAGANINFNKGNIDELAEGVSSIYGSSFLQMNMPNNDYLLKEGSPVGIVAGYQMDGRGYYTPEDFNYDSSTGVYTLKPGVPDISAFTYEPGGAGRPSGQQAYPGAPKFKDLSGNDGILDGVIDEKDVAEIGDMNPKHTGGFNITANYKNFDLGIYFNWSYGNKIYNANKLASLYHITKGGGLFGNKMEIVNGSYKYYDIQNGGLVRITDPGALNALNAGANLPSTYLQQGYVSDIGIEDGSYLRLNTLTLGYTLPKQLMEKMRISNFRIYGTIYNLWTLTGYSGLDPEVNANKNLNSARYPTPGLDWGTYPRSRSFVLGINLAF